MNYDSICNRIIYWLGGNQTMRRLYDIGGIIGLSLFANTLIHYRTNFYMKKSIMILLAELFLGVSLTWLHSLYMECNEYARTFKEEEIDAKDIDYDKRFYEAIEKNKLFFAISFLLLFISVVLVVMVMILFYTRKS